MMLRLDRKGRPYQSTEYGLHGEDVKREISLVSDNDGMALKSVESLMRKEAEDKAEKVGEYNQRRLYFEKEMQKKMKEMAKEAYYRDMVTKEQLRVNKMLSGAEMAALEYRHTSKRPNTSLPAQMGSANFSQQTVVSAHLRSVDPRQPHTDFEKIVNGEIIGAPVGTPVIGYDPVSQASSTPQMSGFFSDLADQIGLKEEYQAVRDAVKGEVREEVEVFQKDGVQYIKNATGDWINKSTGELLNKGTATQGQTPPNIVKVPGIGYVDKTWLYVGGGVLGLGLIMLILRLRK